MDNKRSRKLLMFFWKLFEVFAEIRRKNSILVIVWAFWIVREVESYEPSKFQPPTMLGDHQNVEKTIQDKIYFLGLQKSVFRNFPWILEELHNFRCPNLDATILDLWWRRSYSKTGDFEIFLFFCFSKSFEVFAKFHGKKSISLIVRALWHVLEVKSCALWKLQAPTMLATSKTLKKRFAEN